MRDVQPMLPTLKTYCCYVTANIGSSATSKSSCEYQTNCNLKRLKKVVHPSRLFWKPKVSHQSSNCDVQICQLQACYYCRKVSSTFVYKSSETAIFLWAAVSSVLRLPACLSWLMLAAICRQIAQSWQEGITHAVYIHTTTA